MAAMARRSLLLLLAALIIGVLFSHASAIHTLEPTRPDAAGDGADDTKVYIVFTERQPATAELPELEASAAISSFHHNMLSDLLDDSSSSAHDRVVYHYSRSLHGFAARLTEDEKNRLAGKDGVLSIHERVVYWPHTTRSWNFLDLPQHNDPSRLQFEKDVIIGMVDTGVWPESESFSDAGLPPPPAKWKGVCPGGNFTCNNKIIGARGYFNGTRTASPLDEEGHGTHTASTAAGRAVAGASLGGVARGTARGAVPGARLAVYKVCWPQPEGCGSDSILAAFDDAIADGVDVISASLGNNYPEDYPEDPLAVGAFHAMRRGVVTSLSAGNSGPTAGSVTNVAPWAVSVAAVTTDRKIVSEIVLGLGNDGKRFVVGNAVTAFPHLGKQQPSLLVDPGSCGVEDLEGRTYKGAVLLCRDGVNQATFKATDADAAIILMETDTAFSFAIPAVFVTKEQYDDILDFYNSTRLPMVTVKNSETVMDKDAPSVASFSSRGPNRITHGIIKPDISAPGVDILAAWTPLSTVSGLDKVDDRHVPYNIISGTSMACPHVTGAAAYVKSVHPDWSPAAVLSALVTTATPVTAAPEAEFAHGAGQVNPLGARYPGLVYDAGEADYIAFLCAQGYNASQLATMTGSSSAACPKDQKNAVGDLNYPSIAVPVINYGVPFTAEFPRRVTNVGPSGSVYRAKVTSAPGIKITVAPEELAFSASNQTLGFKVSVSGVLSVNGTLGASASLVWSDGRHVVRSPIFVFPHKHVS
ncbi:hypothetical protein EJB05_13350 [Eragrostis curvula]|uniref:Uncharacterized protein n=1 Tax=Eragrostis curvula TaxID=38414 RepID=A0A5J9VW93_9POAL|nr:hypothetical protein EJB05_13350 [Eragrostis curvula]